MNQFNFIFNGNIFFGIGARNNIDMILKSNNYKKACIVVDHALMSVSMVKDYISEFKCETKIIICDISEPNYNSLENKRKELGNIKFDVFIGIGGGSALDLAKGLSVLSKNDGPAISYRGFNKFNPNIPPIIGIPTTAGTGSEITPNASFIDINEKKKMGINGEAIRPKYAILDPEMTLSCPLGATISAGVDSLVHATEAFSAKKSNKMANLFAREGFQIVIDNLPLIADNLDNYVVREKLMYGAFLSAIALMNSGTGPAAAMSYPLGVRFGVPHGIGGGIFLPHVIKYNIDKGFYNYANLYPFKDRNKSENMLSKEFLDLINQTWKTIKVPDDLRKFGMVDEDVKLFVSDTMDLKGALDQNPIQFYEDEIKLILKKLKIG